MPDAQRRLAAIIAADVAGYSRLVAADEEGTIEALRTLRRTIIDPAIYEHGGRIANTAGDSLLLEFPSVVEATRFALGIQDDLAAQNADVPKHRRIEFRVGINVGDVIAEGNDLLGDGVNVAARLEALADPGGICFSRAARDQVRDRLELSLEDLGDVEVKNISRPVRVFRVLRDGSSQRTAAKAHRLGPTISALIILLATLVGASGWLLLQGPDFEPANPAKFAFALPQKPSIAVLPLANLTGDDSQDYIGDSITENIIAVLSTSPDLFVIARNSSFAYKGKEATVQEVAQRFGVRYVLDGSIQRTGEKLRVTAQLVDAVEGLNIWAERYDRHLIDLFDVQDDIAERILVAMHVKLTRGVDAGRTWEDLGRDPIAYRQFSQGLALFQTFDPRNNMQVEQLVAEVLQKHPNSADANATMGWVQWRKVTLGMSKNPEGTLARAREFANKALAINDQSDVPYILLAALDLSANKHESALKNAERALELAPSGGTTIALAGWVKVRSGNPTEGVELLKLAIRTEPDYPHWIPGELSIGQIMLGRYGEAKTVANGVLASDSDNVGAHTIALLRLAAIAVLEEDTAKAQNYIVRALGIDPTWSLANEKFVTANYKDREFVARYLDIMRKAGLPESAPNKNR